MEKILSVEERIKKAEEIYNRRTNSREQIGYTYSKSNLRSIQTKKLNAVKKMLFQIIVCLFIYAIFYTISNGGYIFSEDFKKNINSLINTQTDFNKIINDTINFFSKILSTNNELNVDNSSENQEEKIQNNQIEKENEKNVIEENYIDEKQSEEDIGGATDETTSQVSKPEKTQMEIDAEDIKNNIDFEIPLGGRISSTFGLRNPTSAKVPKNHTGLDIAASVGTVIKSATDGTVSLASSYGDFGNHLKIEIGDVTIIYAHCSKLYLKEGETVKKGQSIAEVGSTGNSTGPHLHFEIRKDGRPVDPQLILDI